MLHSETNSVESTWGPIKYKEGQFYFVSYMG